MGRRLNLALFGVLVSTLPGAVQANAESDSPGAPKHSPQSFWTSDMEASQEGRLLAVGMASWYGPRFHGRKTANGERYNMHAMTCASKKLPFGTLIRVKNLRNGKVVVVRVNDRGPYARGRIVDLSHAAAKKLGFIKDGHTKVEIRQALEEAGESLASTQFD